MLAMTLDVSLAKVWRSLWAAEVRGCTSHACLACVRVVCVRHMQARSVGCSWAFGVVMARLWRLRSYSLTPGNAVSPTRSTSWCSQGTWRSRG